MENRAVNDQKYYAQGKVTFWRLLMLPCLYIAWFAPHRSIRTFFHRLRGVSIGKNVEIGYFCILGNVHPHLVEIEDNAVVTARVTILEHDNSYYYTSRGNVNYGKVTIKKNAFIGIGSVIMPGITIGEKSIVGALAFVNKDVPPGSIFAGNPARQVEKRISQAGQDLQS